MQIACVSRGYYPYPTGRTCKTEGKIRRSPLLFPEFHGTRPAPAQSPSRHTVVPDRGTAGTPSLDDREVRHDRGIVARVVRQLRSRVAAAEHGRIRRPGLGEIRGF